MPKLETVTLKGPLYWVNSIGRVIDGKTYEYINGPVMVELCAPCMALVAQTLDRVVGS